VKAAANTGIAALRPTTGTAAERDAFFFAEVATWPDLVRSGPRKPLFDHAAWHFADHFWSTVKGKPKQDTTKGPAAENAFERLTHFEQALKADHTAKPDNAIAIAWMLHLMGDLHQPLHNAARETKAFPNGDRGGNDFPLDGKMKLHKYWDDIPDEMFAADHTIFVPPVSGTVALESPTYVNAWALRITTAHPKASVPHDATVDAFETWSQEALPLAEAAYPGVKAGTAPSAAYRTKTDNVSELAIAEAGYRLAAVLNAVLK
jgi:hypothetical protein